MDGSYTGEETGWKYTVMYIDSCGTATPTSLIRVGPLREMLHYNIWLFKLPHAFLEKMKELMRTEVVSWSILLFTTYIQLLSTLSSLLQRKDRAAKSHKETKVPKKQLEKRLAMVLRSSSTHPPHIAQVLLLIVSELLGKGPSFILGC